MTTENDDEFQAMRARLADLLPRLNERDRRVAMATEAKSWGWGEISAVALAAGASRKTIGRGLSELSGDVPEVPGRRVRMPAGPSSKSCRGDQLLS